MANVSTEWEARLEDISAGERERLLLFCMRITGGAANRQAAEDLVQQTLLEAWQHASKLYSPEARMPWLFGIARNVSLRWLRSRSREATRQVSLGALHSQTVTPGDETEALAEAELQEREGADPFEEIERADLAAILEQALSLLPPSTRAALIGRYIDDMPQAALADKLSLSEGAVEARLHRGKQALRKLLTTTFSEQLAGYGLKGATAQDAGSWQETRIWCPECGQRRLVARFPEPGEEQEGSITFLCPGCNPASPVPRSVYTMTNPYFQKLVGGLTQPRAVLNRSASWTSSYFAQALAAGCAPCTNCGQIAPLFVEEVESVPGRRPIERMLVICHRCNEVVSTSLNGLIGSAPAVQQFWRRHGRIRTVPTYEVEAQGTMAVVASYKSVAGADEITLLVARSPFRILQLDSNAKEDI